MLYFLTWPFLIISAPFLGISNNVSMSMNVIVLSYFRLFGMVSLHVLF